MPSCAEMKKGQIYVCQSCGVELQVIKECTECEENCATDPCAFSCCNQELTLKG